MAMHEPQENLRHELGSILKHANDQGELEVLVEGLLTPQEIEEVVRRWRLLKRLIAGETQRDISRELGVSLGKISRGSRLLQYGPPKFRDLVTKGPGQ